jgi:azurin
MRRISLAPVFACSLLFVAGCGKKESDQTTAPPVASPGAQTQQQPAPAPAAAPPAPAPAPAPPAKPDAEGIVRMTANDQMRFNTNRIEAPAGKIKIELKNVGALPKEVMGHNFIVLKPGTDPVAFGAKAMPAKATDYIPADKPEVLGHTKLLGPGESDTLEIELTAGTYPFLCSFPGHVGLMSGQLVVN